MKKLWKIMLGLAAALIVAAIGLSLFVRVYLTEDRIKSLLIPPAEAALGRTVSIGAIKVGLFSGITVNDFAIKEKDAKTDFVSAQAFVLRYSLLPLLQKQLIVREVLLRNPKIIIHRGPNGIFNFETLAVLKKEPNSVPHKPAPAGGQAILPLALTVNQIRIEQAQVKLSDAMGELPDVDASLDLTVGLDIARSLAALKYHGKMTFSADALYGKLKPHVTGSCSFDREQISLKADVKMDREQAQLDGQVENYLAAPAVRLDITSPDLDLDHLLALMVGLPRTAAKAGGKAPSSAPAGAIGKKLPPGLTASGRISVAKTTYKKMAVTDLLLLYTLKDGVFTVKDFSAHTAGGVVKGDVVVNLMQPDLAYQGRIAAQALQAGALKAALYPAAAETITGALDSTLSFSGSGTEWSKIRKSLDAKGDYALREALIKNTGITNAIAAVLNLPELETLSFKDVSGSVLLNKGKALVSLTSSGKDLNVETKGTVGLDGSLDFPITLELAPALSEKLKARTSLAKYLVDEQGKTVLRLDLVGTVQQPRPAIDAAQAKEQVEKTIKKKLEEEIDKKLSNQEEKDKAKPALDLLRGILGQ